MIYDYDPTRKERLTYFCNLLRLHVPAWFRMRCSLFRLNQYTEPETRAVMDAKTLGVWYISLAAACHHCGQPKSSALTLRYLRHDMDAYNCEKCSDFNDFDPDY
jgi:hypothetical protein